MGHLVMMGNDPYTFTLPGGIKVCRKFRYTNKDAITNVLRYITRTRPDEERADDLKVYGVWGASSYDPIEFVIHQFQVVQSKYNQDNGRKIYHFVYTFTDEELNLINGDYTLVANIGHALSKLFWDTGYQVVFAVHDETSKRIHIHFAVNSVNFVSGLKFHISKANVRELSSRMSEISKNIVLSYLRPAKAISFFNA